MIVDATADARAMLRYALAAFLSLPCAPGGAGAAPIPAPEAGAPGHRLSSLASELARAPEDVRADLAGIALDELAAAYAQEAARAREDMRRHGADRGLLRWAEAVERLATHLAALAQSVTSLTAVSIGQGPERSLYLVIDGEPVVISGPGADQATLDQRIIRRFCNLHDCVQLLAGASQIEMPPPPAPTASRQSWRFSDAAGPVCSSGDGLDFAFRDSTDLLQKRAVCERAISELSALAEALARHASSGARIEWNALEIRRGPAPNVHEVALDSDGATLELYLPLLAAAPRLLSETRPWLTARIDGRQHRVVIENADRLLSALDRTP